MARNGRDHRRGRAPLAGAAAALLALTLIPPAGSQEDFITGSGQADASIVQFGPKAARLSLAPTFGVSLADYQNTVGRGEARVLDYAAIEGEVPEDFTTQFPPARSESTDEDSEQGDTRTVAGAPEGAPLSAGAITLHASSDDSPLGRSEVTVSDFDLVPGVVEFSNTTASSVTGVVVEGIRSATGTVRIGELRLGGGVVVMRGLEWQATQETGASEQTSGSFGVDSVRIAGTPLPVPTGGSELATAFAAANDALAPTGLVLVAPRAETEGGIARISPLGIRIEDSELGNTVLAPVIEQLQPYRQPITDALIEQSADAATAILVADVTLGVLTGASNLLIEFGGATAFTEGTRFGNPFGSVPPAAAAELHPSPSASVTGPRTATAPPSPSAEPVPPVAASENVNSSTVPPIPGGRGGALVAVALIGLLATGVVAAADWWRIRRSGE